MDKQEIRRLIMERVGERSLRMGLRPEDVTDELDLLQSGVLDSLAFVDLFVALMDATGRDLDLESALSAKGATTIGGLVHLFS